MPPTETPLARLDRLLRQGDMSGAVQAASEMLEKSRQSFPAWLGRAAARLNLGHLADADADIATACRLAPNDLQALLIRGMIDQRLGRIDRAAESLARVADSKAPQAVEAAIALSEVLWFAHRHDALRARVAAGGAWLADPRAAIAVARLRAEQEPEAALAQMLELAERGPTPVVRRVAGFDAVGVLDRLGRYREAFELATRLHAATTPPFDLEGYIGQARDQRALVEKGERWITPRIEPVEGVALVVGLPRSGTTLLEQMLDRHPAIGGIGEYEGIDRIGGDLTAMGRWPRGLALAPREALGAVQRRYLDGAHRLRRPDATWSFDKTLRAWRWLPAVAAVLPGARCLHVARDPRDMAISIFLSYFHPVNDGWTASLASIRRVVEAERAILPRALEVLGLAHEKVVYEDLVADPRGHAERALALLGLPMDDRVLAPEANTRAVFTLSHAQVRKPIHRGSIGRWANYAFAFDGSWDAMAAAHDARRGSA